MNNYISQNSKKNKIQTQPNKRTKFAKHGVKDEQAGEIFKFFFSKIKRIFLPSQFQL